MSLAEPNRAGRPEHFVEELAEFWRVWPDKALFFGMALCWAGLFQFFGSSTFGYIKTHSLFGWMYYVFSTSEDDGHGLFIPWVVLALVWWKRKELAAVPKSTWWPGFLLVALGVMLHLAGYMVQQNRISIVGFFVGVYGIIGMVWGRGMLRAILFPFFLFLFCVPLGTMADSLTFPLRMLVSVVSAGIGQHVLGIDVVRVGTQLFDARQGFSYDVAAACSGIRSLTVLLALTTIYGFVTFRTPWKRLLMVGIAIPLAVLGNIVRITGLIITAETFGEKAGKTFHDSAGFVIFVVALGCVLGLGTLLREPIREGQPA